MGKKIFYATILSIFFFCLYSLSFAQNYNKHVIINWEKNIIYFENDDTKKEALYFENAIYEDTYKIIPQYFEKIPIDQFFNDFEVLVSNIKTVPVEKKDIDLIPADYGNQELSVTVKTVIEKKKNFASVSCFPVLKKSTGQYEKVLSFDLQVTCKNSIVPLKKSYIANSILSSGNWYKIKVAKSGIFKVTYQDMVNLGVSTNNLKASNIAIYGNGGGMLPESNNISRRDDISPIPVQLYNVENDIFGPNSYFIFYAQGPHTWSFDSVNSVFSHQFNIYDNYAYYFINTDAGIGEKKRIQIINNQQLNATQQINDYVFYDFYETDLYNLVESGKTWLSDRFDITLSRKYNFPVNYIANQLATIRTSLYFSSSATSSFNVYVNNSLAGTVFGSSPSALASSPGIKAFNSTVSGNSITVQLDYERNFASFVGYLDWIEIQVKCQLNKMGDQFPFCNPSSVVNNSVSQFNIANTSNLKVWNITNITSPYQISGTLSENTYSFKCNTSSLQYFIAFDESNFFTIEKVGKINNQNLHSHNNEDFIIISHPNFQNQADILAQYRRNNDGFSVKVVTPQQVYNEFSSGAQDPTAIRDYMKMIYDKTSGLYPKYLLLFGRPSYDYRQIVSGTELFVPNYQCQTILRDDDLRANDDYFSLLDFNEGSGGTGFLDLAVGRFPVSSFEQAKIAVDKTINYSRKDNIITDPASVVITNLADWRNIITFVADDEDRNTHISTADNSANILKNANKNINIEKIYCDAYPQISYSGGVRYPDVNKAINNRMQRGCFMISYIGHGGGNGWAHERILETRDISTWSNKYNLPVMTTLTCSFAWYDRPAVSPGELIFLSADGGASALIATSRTAFTGPNDIYSRAMYTKIFPEINGQHIRFGDINMLSKNAVGGATSGLNMIYSIGDPSMPLAIPDFKIVTDSIIDYNTKLSIDTVSALSKVTIKGHICSSDGTTLTNFKGNVFPSIFDKATLVTTLSNDGEASPPFTFSQQKNILFKGNTSVNNGKFEFTFIVPKDINYEYGNGKISYYARSNNSDATGSDDSFIIGGSSNNQYDESLSPEIQVYLNDNNFVNGSIVEPNPTLIVHLKDEFGINMTGNGIGHDLVAIIDNKTEEQLTLNDYYTSDVNSSNSGIIRYPMKGISIGKHQLKVRAWNILNQASEKTINFEVVADDNLTISHLLNYPNPFTTHTDFYFEQNKSGDYYEILIQIFTISGKLVKTITEVQFMQGNRSNPIGWNGLDDFGDKIGKGVYIYKLKIKNSAGKTTEKIEKLVIL